MKKIIFTLMLMLVTALAVNAQNLVGKQWCTVLNDEDGEGIAVALTFEKNGSCEMLIAAQQEMKEDGVPITLIAAVTVPGTYKLDGKDLNNSSTTRRPRSRLTMRSRAWTRRPKPC